MLIPTFINFLAKSIHLNLRIQLRYSLKLLYPGTLGLLFARTLDQVAMIWKVYAEKISLSVIFEKKPVCYQLNIDLW